MALKLTKTVFLHVPKTGGSWVTVLLRQMGLVRHETSRPHMRWSEILEDPSLESWHDLRPFLFVRHPVSWYRSYWAYKVRNGWEKGNWLDEKCQSSDFRIFVQNCVSDHPGLLAMMYAKHTKGVSFVRHFETLKEGLLEALKEEGVTRLWDLRPINTSPTLPDCPPDLALTIEGSELTVMKTWGYSSVVA